MLSAFLFLNSQKTKIVHRDIKDKNVIIWIGNKQIKILDFGLSHEIDSPDAYMSSLVETNNWMAPEI
jgi:serine/threonine protein kinase